ncbi:MAG: hypothetical protein CK425_09320 [Parachlamydia sp.]|nr:MAG: hypothetical protein CK425_09320 [Parachlamydia sp.]
MFSMQNKSKIEYRIATSKSMQLWLQSGQLQDAVVFLLMNLRKKPMMQATYFCLFYYPTC